MKMSIEVKEQYPFFVLSVWADGGTDTDLSKEFVEEYREITEKFWSMQNRLCELANGK